jgi:hypothetical protein
MLIQFNIDAEKFQALILNRFQRVRLCLPNEFEVRTKRSIVDHIRPTGLPTIRRVSWLQIINVPRADSLVVEPSWITGSKLQIVQPIHVYIAHLDELKKAAGKVNNVFVEFEINVILDLTISLPATPGFLFKPEPKRPPEICLSFSEIDWGLARDEVTEEQKKTIIDSIKKNTKEICTKVDLSSLTELLGYYPDIINAGVSAYGTWDDVDQIAIRLEVRDPGMTIMYRYSIEASWKRFYEGYITEDMDGSIEDLSTMDWSVFIDQRILLPAILNRFKSQISSSRKFSLEDGPHAEWYSSRMEFDMTRPYEDMYVTHYGLAIVQIKFSGEAIDVMECGWRKIDLDLDITVTAELLVKAPNLLQIHARISWDSNDLELLCIEFTAGLEGALFGASFGGWAGPIGAAVGAIVGFIVGFIGAIVAATIVKPPSGRTPGCTESDEGKTLDCELPVASMASDAFGVLEISRIRGIAGGLLLGGTLKSPPKSSDLFDVPSVEPFRWEWENPCIREPKYMVRGNVTYGFHSLSEVCEIKVREDPLKQFEPYLKFFRPATTPGQEQTDIRLSIPQAELKPEYLSAPYPCHILFKTSAGARWITVGTIPKLTPEREAELKEDLPHLRSVEGFCIPLPYYNPFRRGEVIRPTFVSDEPEDWFGLTGKDQVNGDEDYNIWRIIAGKLMPGEHVELRTNDGRLLLAEGVANSRGFAELGMLAPLKSEKTEFSLKRTFSDNHGTQPEIEASNIVRSVDDVRARDETTKENQALTIKRIQLKHQCTLDINGSCLGLTVGLFEGYSTIFILTDQGLNMYDVNNPRYPRLSYQLPESGLHSVVMWKGMLITADNQGLALPLDQQRSATRIFEDTGIRALKAGREYLYALKDDDRIDVLSRDFERIRSFQMESGSPVVDIAATSSLVAVNRVHRIDVYDMQNPNGPTPARTLAINGAVKLSTAKLATSNNSFYVHNPNGGGRVIDFSEDSGIVTAEYHEDPWFVGAVRMDNVFARLGLNSTQIELYRIVGTRTR